MTEEEKRAEAKLAAVLLKMAEAGHGNGQQPDDDYDYGRKKLTQLLPNHPEVVERLVELEIKSRVEGVFGKASKKWWQIF